jgi:hypothetical protein
MCDGVSSGHLFNSLVLLLLLAVELRPSYIFDSESDANSV